MRAANQEAGDKAEQGNNTEARQRKHAKIRERAKTGNQSQAPARPIYMPKARRLSPLAGSITTEGMGNNSGLSARAFSVVSSAWNFVRWGSKPTSASPFSKASRASSEIIWGGPQG